MKDFYLNCYEGPLLGLAILSTIAVANGNSNFAFAETVNPEDSMDTYALKIDDQTYDIQYNITGGKLDNLAANVNGRSIMASINSTESGKLTLVLPRDIIDSQYDGKDTEFVIFNDGQDSYYEEIDTGVTARTLDIYFDETIKEIEIVGTFIVPEFGPIVIMVLAVTMLGIIFTRLNHRFSFLG